MINIVPKDPPVTDANLMIVLRLLNDFAALAGLPKPDTVEWTLRDRVVIFIVQHDGRRYAIGCEQKVPVKP